MTDSYDALIELTKDAEVNSHVPTLFELEKYGEFVKDEELRKFALAKSGQAIVQLGIFYHQYGNSNREELVVLFSSENTIIGFFLWIVHLCQTFGNEVIDKHSIDRELSQLASDRNHRMYSWWFAPENTRMNSVLAIGRKLEETLCKSGLVEPKILQELFDEVSDLYGHRSADRALTSYITTKLKELFLI